MYGYVFFMLRILKHLLFICYFGDLAERENRNGMARRSPSERFPRNYYVESTRSRKCEFLCFSDFIKNKPHSRANVFTEDTETILAVARR